jgi:chromosome segregation ATPase
MRNFLQNLLVIVALGLCGLSVYQWYGQTLQRNEIQTLEQSVYAKAAAIQAYTNSIRTLDSQIALMDARITQLKAEAKTNAQFLITREREASRLKAAAEGLTDEITQYKSALESLEGKLKAAYEAIEKQNQAVKDLVAQRDEFVKKYNDEVKDRNDVVAKYNELAASVEKLRPAAAKQ